jgi:CheY-like chemotaxis protein
MSVSKRKVLIVDDEQVIRDLLIEEFLSLRYDVYLLLMDKLEYQINIDGPSVLV